ncbi:glycosyltransferase family 2 protein [Formosa sp. S-31]|uniref:glycosyltransferase family 2 protein n=1 Tax=Formosa sp. S-31 TaxID=2790949 RepID=UPI003EB9E938
MTNSPLVSIIIPTYNRAHLIGETLDSVLAQTYTNWECIVVDDGSSDSTSEVMTNYCAKDARFQYHHRPADRLPGGNAARNYGFELSKGEFINWLDSDDLIGERKLELQVEKIFKIKKSISICYWKRFVKTPQEDEKQWSNVSYTDYIVPSKILVDFGINRTFLPSHSYLISRDVVLKSNLWNESLSVNQDGEFFTRIILNASFIGVVRDILVFYRRQGKDSKSKLENNRFKIQESIKSWRIIQNILIEYGIGLPHPYLENAKDYLYDIVKQKYPYLIIYYLMFFKSAIKRGSILFKLKEKIF